MTEETKKRVGRPVSVKGRQVQRSIRMPQSQWDAIDARAAKLERSASWVISNAMQASLYMPPFDPVLFGAALLDGRLIPLPKRWEDDCAAPCETPYVSEGAPTFNRR